MRLILYTCFIVMTALIPFNAMAELTGQNIHVKWTYEQPENRVIAGYKLYQEGVEVCNFTVPSAREGDCTFNSEPGEFDFTLTAYTDDGLESLMSVAYTFELTNDRNPPVLLRITGRQVEIVID